MTRRQSIDALRLRAESFRASLASFRPKALVAACVYHEMQRSARKNIREGPLIAGAEYVAILLADEIASGAGEAPDSEQTARVAEEYRKIFDDTYAQLERLGPLSGVESMVGRIASSGLSIRNPAIPQHWRALLRAFAPRCDARFESSLGFSLSDALAVVHGSMEICMDAFDRWNKDCRERAAELWRKQSADLTPNVSENDRRLIEIARSQRKVTKRKALQRLVWQEAQELLENNFTLSADQISEKCALPFPRIVAIFEALTLTPAPLEQRLLPSPRNALAKTPFLRLADQRVFVPHPALLQWAVLPRMEQLLNARDPQAFEKYERIRAKFLEAIAADLFAKLGHEVSRNVKFETGGKVSEIDVVARLDTTAYVIECKATTISDAAWRAADRSVESNVVRLLTKAAGQATFARDALAAFPEEFALSGVQEFIPMVLTLDHLNAIATAPQAIANSDVAKSGIWFLPIASLYSLVDLIEEGWRLKHYARRRLLVDAMRYSLAVDELDYYDAYLFLNTCAFPRAPTGHMVFLGYTDETADYYHALDQGKSAKKPIPSTPQTLLSIIRTLRRGSAAGWTDAVCDLLDFSYGNQGIIGRRFSRSRKAAREGGMLTSRLRDPDNGIGICYTAFRDGTHEQIRALAQLGVNENPIAGISRWLFITDDINVDEAAVAYFVFEAGNWQPGSSGLGLGELGLTCTFQE